MPVDEGQEPQVPNGGQPIVEGSDETLSFQPYDPKQFRAKQDDGETPQEPNRLYGEDGKPLPSFDPRYAEDFEGLLYLGALTRSFEWLGHEFAIRTLGIDDILAVPQIIKPWQGTLGEARAYATCMAALCVISIDGQELPIPVGDGKGEYAWAFQRFNYVKANWFEFTIDKVYSEFRALEGVVTQVLEAMEKASGPAASTGGSNATSAGPSDRDY